MLTLALNLAKMPKVMISIACSIDGAAAVQC